MAGLARARVGRWLKIILKTIFWLFFALVLVITGSLIYIISNPQGAWNTVDKYLMPADLDVTWEKIDFVGNKRNWREWEIQWEMQGLKVVKGDPEVLFKVDHIGLDFGLRIWMGNPWFSFRSFEIFGGDEMNVRLGPSKDETPMAPQSPYEMARTYLGYLGGAQRVSTVEKLNILIPRFRFQAHAAEPLDLAFKVKKRKEEKSNVSLNIEVKRGELNILLAGLLGTLKVGTKDGPFFEGDLTIKAGKVTAENKLKLSDDGDLIGLISESIVQFKIGKKAIRATPLINVLLSESKADLDISTGVTDIPGPLVKLEKVQAKASIPLENGQMWSNAPASFRVWSLVELFFVDKDMRQPLEKECECKIPERLEVAVAGKAWLETLTGSPKRKSNAADVLISIESVSNKLFSADLNANVDLDKEGESWIISPAVNSELVVHHFQGLRKFLDARGIMIPAPFDVLNGTIRGVAKSALARTADRMKFATQIVTNLNSPHQVVRTTTDINIDLDEKFKGVDVYVKALIEDLQLELPPLDPIRGIPPVSRDTRVLLKPKVSKTTSGFKTRIFTDVSTQKPGAVRLLTKLAKPHIPITIDFKSAQGTPDGYLKLEPFTLSYLRRSVAVEGLKVDVEDKEDGGLLVNGRFRVDQADYKIFITVSGKLESPNITMTSDPYLPKNEIISVLLYNRTSEQLNSSDAETAGNFQGAIADKAIGLFGLWAFASTPIQSFSYNPVTKTYTATVQLGEGLTAGVGTNWERSAQLEVRKRVSRRWVLTASLSPTEEQEQVGRLVLQWERRF